MTKPSPPDPTSDVQHDDERADRPAESATELRRGVLRQREHIKALTGEDPLRGGIAD